MSEDKTSLWENIKGRIKYLKEHSLMMGEGSEVALALTEECDRLHERIDELEEKINSK